MTAPRNITTELARRVESLTLQGKGRAEIAAETGEPRQRIDNIRRDIGLLASGESMPIRATVDLWGKVPTDEIATRVGVERQRCTRLATLLGLGPNPADIRLRASLAIPNTRRRWRHDELTWAAANAADPQAVMIAGLVGAKRPAPVFQTGRA